MSRLELALDIHGRLAKLVSPATPDSIRASSVGLWRSPPLAAGLVVAIVGLVLIWLGHDKLLGLGGGCLGGGFYALWTSSGYIRRRTFDSSYNQVYLVRLALGVVAGTVLSMLPLGGAGQEFSQISLGMIGGFSAEAVALILKRLADTLVTAVTGTGDEKLRAREVELTAQKNSELDELRQEIVGKVVGLQSSLPDEERRKELQPLIDELLSK